MSKHESQNLENYCTACKTSFSYSSLKDSGSFYVIFDVKTSLGSLLQDRSVVSELFKNLTKRKNRTDMQDIVDGAAYRKLELEEFDITYSMNTDGVALLKSSKSSLWPILLSSNELN